MSMLNLSLPEPLRAFVEEQASLRGLGNGGDYIRELIRRDRERQALRGLLGGHGASPCLAALRERLQRRGRHEG